jgi:hypothetical protein
MIVTLETQLIWLGREYEPGQQIDLPDEDAKRFLERGMASAVTPPVEVAAITYDRGRKHGRIPSTRTQPRNR